MPLGHLLSMGYMDRILARSRDAFFLSIDKQLASFRSRNHVLKYSAKYHT